jgi:hypothetical protein
MTTRQQYEMAFRIQRLNSQRRRDTYQSAMKSLDKEITEAAIASWSDRKYAHFSGWSNKVRMTRFGL